jgi:hypothetical protein
MHSRAAGVSLRGHPLVLMDEAAEHVVADDVAGGGIDPLTLLIPRDGKPKASVWPMPVVMADVVGKDPFEVAASGDQGPVEAFGSHGPDPTPTPHRVEPRSTGDQ